MEIKFFRAREEDVWNRIVQGCGMSSYKMILSSLLFYQLLSPLNYLLNTQNFKLKFSISPAISKPSYTFL